VAWNHPLTHRPGKIYRLSPVIPVGNVTPHARAASFALAHNRGISPRSREFFPGNPGESALKDHFKFFAYRSAATQVSGRVGGPAQFGMALARNDILGLERSDGFVCEL